MTPKTGIMEPEAYIARQRLGKQVSAASDTPASMQDLLGKMFLFCPCKVVIQKSSVGTMALGSTQPLTEMSTRNLPGGKWWPAVKADNLTAICEPIV
jgi:hypothetical protein